MSKLVAVYIEEKVIKLSFWKGNKQYTRTINVANRFTKNALTDEECFTSTFSYISNYLKKHEMLEDVGYLVGIPDSFGLGETTQVFRYARKNHVDVLRLIPYTTAAALALTWNNIEGDNIWVVIDDGRDIEIGDFNLFGGLAERNSTYIFKDCRWKDIGQSKCYNPQVGSAFDRPGKVFYIFKDNCRENIEMIRNSLPFLIQSHNLLSLSEDSIIIGLGLQCGKLEGYHVKEEKLENMLALELYNPYQICILVNGELYDLMPHEVTIPTRKIVEIKGSGEADFADGEMEFRLLEHRGNKYVPQLSFHLDKNEAKSFWGKNFYIVLDVDTNRVTNIVLQNEKGNQKFYLLHGPLVKLCNSEKKDKGFPLKVGEGQDNHILKDLLPVFDNLAYGVNNIDTADNPFAQGMASIYKQAKNILDHHGIELIDRKGVPFDVKYHNAVDHIRDPHLPPNTVAKVIQVGFMENGKVLKPANVIVAN